MTLTSSRRVVGSLAVALLAFLAWNTSVRAQAKKSDAVVKATAKADKPDADGKQTVTITLDIENPWHLYANPVGNEDLANAKTDITLSAKAKLEDVKIEYPDGKVVVDSAVGNYKVYEGKITIKAKVKRAKGDDSPLEVSIKLQACDDKRCLLPATVKVTAP
jgi:uncharacterized protein